MNLNTFRKDLRRIHTWVFRLRKAGIDIFQMLKVECLRVEHQHSQCDTIHRIYRNKIMIGNNEKEKKYKID